MRSADARARRLADGPISRAREPLRLALHRWLAVLVCLAGFAAPAFAHKASDAYLQMSTDADAHVRLRWDIALRDLDVALDLDADHDRQLRWGELRPRLDEVVGYATDRLVLNGGACRARRDAPVALEPRVDGQYLVLDLATDCDARAPLDLDYRLFADVDPTHRGLLRQQGTAGVALRSLDPSAGPARIEPDAGGGGRGSAAGLFGDGVHHILIGYDHILFLICLLLPAVLRRREDGWRPVVGWRDAAWPMLGVVTMFTLAHSLMLALAGLGIVHLSPRIVEPGIALTIILAAADNVWPLLRGRRKLFAFLFGLIHGFGFASVLQELDLPALGFARALVEFNLGVEAGQLVVVSIALAVLLAARHWHRYTGWVLRGGSGAAAALASVWFVERVFDLQVLPSF